MRLHITGSRWSRKWRNWREKNRARCSVSRCPSAYGWSVAKGGEGRPDMIPDPQDTIVALSSAPGPGARAIVRVSGPAALRIALSAFCPAEPIEPTRRRRYAGQIHLLGLSASLSGDLCFWPGRRTYTGQELVEIHTLSSPPLTE